MRDLEAIFTKIVAHPRYQRGLDWGSARPGHPEGSIRAHLGELDANLESIRDLLSTEQYWKIRVLVHTHDTFKSEAERGVAISHPRSHASLARAFLAEFCDDPDLSCIVQYHDEPYALWRQIQSRGEVAWERFDRLLGLIRDWQLFLLFLLVDGSTQGKAPEPLDWFFQELSRKVAAVADLAPIWCSARSRLHADR